ncbi:hypothetical protein C8Q77DRAFT_1106744 [Trametes polyzona]|nr:hypothetical protein C8Q77DRAFT_1106744 [Trametes polyzona]
MPSRLSDQHNVVLKDYHGTVLSGFYQYGVVSWKTFFRWLSLLFDKPGSWIITTGDRLVSQQYSPTDAIVMPGKYTVLSSDWSPIRITLVPAHARPPQPTSSRVRRGELNLNHARERDRKSMSSTAELSWCRLQAAHNLSNPRPMELKLGRMERRSSDSDIGVTAGIGRRPKHASLQNMWLLREDLQDAWANYEFGVDPDDCYRITAFIAGHDNIVGRMLETESISSPGTCPLDDLLRDHFLQGLLKHVKGHGELHWDFGAGALDLSDSEVWGTEEGKERLELELENRLFDHRQSQGELDDPARSSLV